MKIKRFKNNGNFVKINERQLVDFLERKKTFVFVVTGNNCNKCDLLKESFRDYLIETNALIFEISYFNNYQKISLNQRKTKGLPSVYSFPTIVLIENGTFVEDITMTNQSALQIKDNLISKITLLDEVISDLTEF